MAIHNILLLIVTMLAIGGTAAVLGVRFFQQPTEDQIAAVKEWLLYAVTEAEKNLGEKTGKLKLRQCYDLFVQRFPAVAKVIPFSTFSGWVDAALEEMKRLLEGNRQIAEYVHTGEKPPGDG